jgi:hypothetical protein
LSAQDVQLLEDLFTRAERLSRDPLQQLLLFVGLQEESTDALADEGLALFEGAYVLSRALGEPQLLKGELRHFRTYLELLFGQPAATPAAALARADAT